MGAGDVIREARAAGRDSLSEHESKLLLAEAGIPVVREVKARNVGEALEAARDTGFPVVLKGLGSRLLHKTERGLVHLNIRTKAQLERAARAIEREAAQDLEGFLVQPFLSGRREFVIGMNRDGVFGPVVMFGLGGVFTEALADFSLRLAPLEKRDALAMIGEIRAKRLLGPFRGEAAVDVGALADALVGLSRLVHEHPEIREVDVNPLLVTGGGVPVAVDALVVLGDGQEDARAAQPVDPRAIANLFYPKSIAFIGASARLGKWGHMLP
ncbi:MAG TPA: acetate--CoA ligase family protein, partial [Deltaproteobacteria bacterium]|nr:acetate--CoA ligase family protein [Deltaproteobacteria bacterium]